MIKGLESFEYKDIIKGMHSRTKKLIDNMKKEGKKQKDIDDFLDERWKKFGHKSKTV